MSKYIFPYSVFLWILPLYGLPDPDKKLFFKPFMQMSTYGCHGWEAFVIDGEQYLVTANLQATPSKLKAPHHIKSAIYKWNGSTFVEYQWIDTVGAAGWAFFTIDRDHYLALANTWNDFTSVIDSKVFRWHPEKKKFEHFQDILTEGAYSWEHVKIETKTRTRHFIMVSNFCRNVPNQPDLSNPKLITHQYCPNYNTHSHIYEYKEIPGRGHRFELFQRIKTQGATDSKFFTIEGKHYLAVANFSSNKSAQIKSMIYRWNGVEFADYQSIESAGACAWEPFVIDGKHYLALANWVSNTNNTEINSKIFQWDGKWFTHYQDIPTKGAQDWNYFSFGGKHYLLVSNYVDNFFETNYYDINSTLYIWQNGQFIPHQGLPTTAALYSAYFTIDGTPYLAVANFFDGKSYNIPSLIYRGSLE
ncbi:MAG: hypothetical protein QNK37_30070 [Acidobacteriota bacterium]|nr:hypothetical protein [Acidobacteriota bacterium]